MSRLAKIAPFAVAALIAGCGSSSSSSTTSSAPAAGSSSSASSSQTAAAGGGGQVALSETEFKITPASATVGSTGTITITVKNTGKIAHALAVQTPSGIVRTAAIAPGGSATLKVDASKAGSYVFYCPIGQHRQAGMLGTLIVGGSGAATGASSSSSSSSSGSSGRGGYSSGGGGY
jgi:uncharacterized cupredoxin-like copper-binding protein